MSSNGSILGNVHSSGMSSTVAFVGAGPTTLYTLSALLSRVGPGVEITVFEAQPVAGLGTPYRPGWNDPAMLSNIASIEIPPLTETLLAWLQRKSGAEIIALGLDPREIDERLFVPRVVLGEYFREQFEALVEQESANGVVVTIETGCRVIDAANMAEGMLLTLSQLGEVRQERFDHVVLATGHQWPSQQEVRPGYFLSPWPAATLASVPPVDVGIRGSSLTAIDAAVALAGHHGAFVKGADGVSYSPASGSEGLRMTMISRKGLLPEADFFFPLPHTPLSVCTAGAVADLIAGPGDDLLEAAFGLFKRELELADTDYFQSKGLANASLESFSESYFAERVAADPFEWAEANLAEARQNHQMQITVPWRYAILRMHDVLAAIVPHLDGRQFDRFSRHLKPIFVDDYGAVPHESIERLLALHRAGKLDVLAVGDDYRIDTHRPEGGVLLQQGAERRHFPVFIEAIGQRPLSAVQFPFLSLLEQGIVRDEVSADAPDVARGIVIDDAFHPVAEGIPADRLFCLSLPFIMGRHPFIQGITSSHEMGEIVGEALANAVSVGAEPLDITQSEAA